MRSATRIIAWYGAKISEGIFEQEEIRKRAEQSIEEICEDYKIAIEEMEVAMNRAHLLVSFPSRYSISDVGWIIKSKNRDWLESFRGQRGGCGLASCGRTDILHVQSESI